MVDHDESCHCELTYPQQDRNELVCDAAEDRLLDGMQDEEYKRAAAKDDLTEPTSHDDVGDNAVFKRLAECVPPAKRPRDDRDDSQASSIIDALIHESQLGANALRSAMSCAKPLGHDRALSLILATHGGVSRTCFINWRIPDLFVGQEVIVDLASETFKYSIPQDWPFTSWRGCHVIHGAIGMEMVKPRDMRQKIPAEIMKLRKVWDAALMHVESSAGVAAVVRSQFPCASCESTAPIGGSSGSSDGPCAVASPVSEVFRCCLCFGYMHDECMKTYLESHAMVDMFGCVGELPANLPASMFSQQSICRLCRHVSGFCGDVDAKLCLALA